MEGTYQLSLEWMQLQFYFPLARVRRQLRHFCLSEGTTSRMKIRCNTTKYLGHINLLNRTIYSFIFSLTLYGTLDGLQASHEVPLCSDSRSQAQYTHQTTRQDSLRTWNDIKMGRFIKWQPSTTYVIVWLWVTCKQNMR